ncbi:MAG: GNAT family N-acetyltransferase [Paenibacillaceae bacterium]|nr:GNAT family N-acetyltransferase [Paenibacillaceae bacterium]
MSRLDAVFSAFPALRTERLVMRRIKETDAADVFAFYADPLVTRYLDWHGPSTIDETQALIGSWRQAFAERRLLAWGIGLRPEGEEGGFGASAAPPVIGTVMLMPARGTFDDIPRFPLTLGYDLHPSCWNRGLMYEALQAALAFSRTHIRPHRIQAEVREGNAASLRLLQKLGFEQEGVLRQYAMHEATQEYLDMVMMALLTK